MSEYEELYGQLTEARAALEAAQRERDAAIAERDEVRRHLQAIVTAYSDGALFIGGTDGQMLVDAIHHADIGLKGGL